MQFTGTRRLLYFLIASALTVVTIALLSQGSVRSAAREYVVDKVFHDAETKVGNAAIEHPTIQSTAQKEKPTEIKEDPTPSTPSIVHLPEPTWTPPPAQDPFPSLETAPPPAIPPWNQPASNLHEAYGLTYAPPLFIGFTRAWPILLQAVVSYITAGWPASQIYVVENTGVAHANADAKLTLQNPFYMNHAYLKKLGVNVIPAPVRLNFAQLQNFYTRLAHDRKWPYYFWSHMDVVALSYEAGMDNVTPAAGQPGYKTVYELALQELHASLHNASNPRWADVFFAYDHLTLVNAEAYDEVGGWDMFIPFYMNDCDMHARLRMRNWTQREAKAGFIHDVGTVLKDLRVLYRDPDAEMGYIDPNPAPPTDDAVRAKRAESVSQGDREDDSGAAYYERLAKLIDEMDQEKQHSTRGRNTWQSGQHGGQGEEFYYPASGIVKGMEALTEAGRDVFRQKWGHRDCDLLEAGLKFDDAWRVEKDW